MKARFTLERIETVSEGRVDLLFIRTVKSTAGLLRLTVSAEDAKDWKEGQTFAVEIEPLAAQPEAAKP